MEADRERPHNADAAKVSCFHEGDHSLKTAFKLGYIKGCRCTRGMWKTGAGDTGGHADLSWTWR